MPTLPVRRIQIGQVWKNDATGEAYLITKIYTEALASVAVLRKTGSESEPMLRVHIGNSSGAQTLPGYSPTQDFENL
jgi:hypothetical protein